MTAQQNGNVENVSNETDFAQAFQDLARGERTAAALESHLTALEKKIEELLAKADEEERAREEQSKNSRAQPTESSSGDKSASSS
ncbi:hypothetical protein AOQ84DRAFT_376902 [Glonium stellatum]|uniref:Uncharacterized protein n=1 Tax=Glonium stellatum TaxID=574774 RepID=A0A8E2JSU7_9PEZI|nr:hypothetical protein AOQ84DRAFT_376902 [Glonium stellatum]